MMSKLRKIMACVLCVTMLLTNGVPVVALSEEAAPVDGLEAVVPIADETAADDPAVDEPVADDSAVDEPVADDSVVDEPVADDSAVDEPVADDSVVDEPTADEPVADVPSAVDPAVDEPIMDELAADDPAVDEPVEDDPAVDEPVEDDPAVDEPAADEPVADVPSAVDPAVDEPIMDEPVVDYGKSVAENSVFSTGYAVATRSTRAYAGTRGEDVTATLSAGSVVYVASRSEAGARDERVKVGFYSEATGVLEGYVAAADLRPLNDADVAALQGKAAYHGVQLPEAVVTLPVVAQEPVAQEPTADAPAAEPAPVEHTGVTYDAGTEEATTAVQVHTPELTGEMKTGSRVTVTAEVTGGSGLYAYNYWLFDSTGTIVDRKENTFDSSWTFTAPAEGVYLMRVYATDFATDDHADSAWFYMEGNSVRVSNVTVTGDAITGKTMTATANVTGGSGLYAYNYWLFDSTGTIVDRKENSFDPSWMFTAPAEGVYLMRIYATDFATDDHADSAWFYVEENKVDVSDVTVTGEAVSGKTMTAAATVTGGSGLYAYNYWLFDSTGTIVDRKENTFDTSWEFTAPETGVYLMRIYATDFATDDHADSAWFFIEPAPAEPLYPALELNKSVGNVLCNLSINVVYSFTAPVEGTYYFASFGYPSDLHHTDIPDTYAVLYADEALTEELLAAEDGGTGDCFCVPYTMAAGQTVWMSAGCRSSELVPILFYVWDEEPLIIRNTAVTDNVASVTINHAEENYTFLYELLDENGAELAVERRVGDGSPWTFTMPEEPGRYYIRFSVFNNTCVGQKMAVWFEVEESLYPALALNTPELVAVMEEGGLTRSFIAPADGTYYFASSGWGDLYGAIYADEQLTELLTYDYENSGSAQNFCLAYPMTAGQKVWLHVKTLFSTSTHVAVWDEEPLIISGATVNANTVSVTVNKPESTCRFSYYLYDAQDTMLQSIQNCGDATWTFTMPEAAGNYYISITADNGIQSEVVMTSFTVRECRIDSVSLASGSVLPGATNTASAQASEDAALSFYLLDESGNVLDSLLNCQDTNSWMFTAPEAEGSYTVKAVAELDGRTDEKAVAFTVEAFRIIDVTMVNQHVILGEWVKVDAQVPSPVADTLFSFALLDEEGNTIQWRSNVHENSWTFLVPQTEGTYRIRVNASYGDQEDEQVVECEAVTFTATLDVVRNSSIIPGYPVTAYVLTDETELYDLINFGLYDQDGNMLASKQNTSDTSWTILAPLEEGTYSFGIWLGSNSKGIDDTAVCSSTNFIVRKFSMLLGLVASPVVTGGQQKAHTYVPSRDDFIYSYRLEDEYGNTVDSWTMTGKEGWEWVFTVPETAGRYTVRSAVESTFSDEYAEKTVSFDVVPFRVEAAYLDQYTMLPGAQNTVHAGTISPAEETTYSYFLLDAEGTTLDSLCDVQETSWDFSAPEEGGNYQVRITATYQGQTAERSVSFQVTPFKINYVTEDYFTCMPGGPNAFHVNTNIPEGDITYSYVLLDDAGNVVDSLADSDSSTWSFTTPEAYGSYTMQVTATYGSCTAEGTDRIWVGPFIVNDYISCYEATLESGEEIDVLITTNNNLGLETTLSYYLLDASGNEVEFLGEHTTTGWEDTFSLTAPRSSGSYQFKAVGVCGDVVDAKSVPFTVVNMNEIFTDMYRMVNQDFDNMGVGVPINVQVDLSSVTDGSFTVDYQVTDPDGAVVAEAKGSNQTSWAFTPAVSGRHTISATVWYKGKCRTRQSYVDVSLTDTLTLDEPKTYFSYVDGWEYNFFLFTAPEDGTYYLAQEGKCLDYHNDAFGYEMNAGDTQRFVITSTSIGAFTLCVTKQPQVSIDDVELDAYQAAPGQEGGIAASVDGAETYSYYLLDAHGNAVLSNEDSTEDYWSFIFPASGRYQGLVRATNGVSTREGCSYWVMVFAPVTVDGEQPVTVHEAAAKFTFTAQKAGYYSLTVSTGDSGDRLMYNGESLTTVTTDPVYLEEDGTHTWQMISAEGSAVDMTASINVETSDELCMDWYVGGCYLAGQQLKVTVWDMFWSISGDSVLSDASFLFELLQWNSAEDNTVIASSGWSNSASGAFTLPDDAGTSRYAIRISGTPDGETIVTRLEGPFDVCPTTRLISLTENVTWSGTLDRANAFVFRAPAAGEYVVRTNSDRLETWLYSDSNSTSIYNDSYAPVTLAEGETLYMTVSETNVVDYGGDGVTGTQYSICVSPVSLCVAQVESYHDSRIMVLEGVNRTFVAEAVYDSSLIDHSDLVWILQLFTADGELVQTVRDEGSSYCNANMFMPQSGCYFVRATVTNGKLTDSMDSDLFWVNAVETMPLDTPVTGDADTHKVYRFEVPESAQYFITAEESDCTHGAVGILVEGGDCSTYVDTSPMYEYVQGSDGTYSVLVSCMLSKGNVIDISMSDDKPCSYSMTISR